MVIRSYTADSVASALKQVRTDMGGNAVVLKTRVVDSADSGKMYEVTACLDKPTVEQANKTLASKVSTESVASAQETTTDVEPAGETPRVDLTETTTAQQTIMSFNMDSLNAIEVKLDQLLHADQLSRIGQRFVPEPIAQAMMAMQRAGLPEQSIAEIFNELRNDPPEAGIDNKAIRKVLIKRLEDTIEPELDLKPGDRVLVAGPAGSGKTSLIGRLTAWLTFEKKITVKLISLDNVKVGAMDEIASYADLLGIDEVSTLDNIKIETEAQDDDKVVLIDTCALPFASEQLNELKKQVEVLRPTHRFAVFSALTRSSDIESIAHRMAWLEPTHLIFTMTDLTDNLGSLLVGAAAMNTKIVLTTNSPSSADSFHTPNAKTMADAILGQGVDCE